MMLMVITDVILPREFRGIDLNQKKKKKKKINHTKTKIENPTFPYCSFKSDQIMHLDIHEEAHVLNHQIELYERGLSLILNIKKITTALY